MNPALPQSNPKGRLAGYYLMQAAATPFAVVLSLIATNVAGYTKKTTVSAVYLIGYCRSVSSCHLTLGIGNLIGPQTFQAKDAPQYRPAEVTIIVCWGICLILLIVIRQINVHRNKVKGQICGAPDYVRTKDIEFLDLTDLENPGTVLRVMLAND
jgi:MFS transporter, ACS family, allantoate permease